MISTVSPCARLAPPLAVRHQGQDPRGRGELGVAQELWASASSVESR